MGAKRVFVGAGLALGLAVLVAFIASRAERESTTSPAPEASTQEAKSKPREKAKRRARPDLPAATYASLVLEIDQRVKSLQARTAKLPTDWLTRMHLATALLDRASLTNQVDDFERVQTVLDEAFAIAPDGSGPLPVAARLNFAIHRLDVAEGFVDRMDQQAMQKPGDRLLGRRLRAQIALQRGDYEAAYEGLSDVASADPTIGKAELALYFAKTGEVGQAEVLLEEALAGTSDKDPRRRAWTRLQLGLLAMDRGSYRVALEHLREADAELPGWWLVQEHIAEAHHVLGDTRDAVAVYEQILGEHRLAPVMDALASLYPHVGQPEKVPELRDRARALWEDQIARLPEASMGHGLLHYLQFGPPERALELARANLALRPGGDAHVALARAYLKAGKAAEALAIAKEALSTPYRSAALHDVASKAHAALGETEAAEAERARCFALNPWFQDLQHSH